MDGAATVPAARRGRLQENARFILFRCADNLNGQDYYESVDLIDAYHPQTIIAHASTELLPIRNGAAGSAPSAAGPSTPSI